MEIMKINNLDFFRDNTFKEVMKIRNARVKRLQKDREDEEKRRKDEAAKQSRDAGTNRRRR